LSQWAPDFTLIDHHGTPVRLSSFRGQPVLVVFYPWAFSGICGGELRALRDARFEDDGTVVLAISVDSMFALRVFADAEGFDFPLLADCWPHGEIASLYGAFDETVGVALRGSFLIDREGIVRWSVVKGIGEARDIDDYRRAIEELGP
jgi:peroxiredoxin